MSMKFQETMKMVNKNKTNVKYAKNALVAGIFVGILAPRAGLTKSGTKAALLFSTLMSITALTYLDKEVIKK